MTNVTMRTNAKKMRRNMMKMNRTRKRKRKRKRKRMKATKKEDFLVIILISMLTGSEIRTRPRI